MAEGWVFAIDRGGTFTDCIGVSPRGEVRVAKVLSSDTAPVEGVRRILREAGSEAAEADSAVRLGTTVATNALLERRGVPTLFVANRGLGDVLAIGTQERPELFDLAIRKPPPLHVRVAEVPGRVAVDGTIVEPFDADAARELLLEARAAGIVSVAISLMHAYAYPDFEARLAALARDVGFEHVVASHEVAREMGLLARGETASVDAYLTPLLRAHVGTLRSALPGARLRLMQSSGGLTEADRFRGPFALLSGPAGGVVGAAHVAAAAGHSRAVGFDMGGTSTDVSLLRDGEVDRSFETLVGGVRVKAPMLRIHTVAAGGGSLCRFDGFRLTVGPESAGADPGPLCYGQAPSADEPGAGELALTDANFFLGRVQPDRFPFALDSAPVDRALARCGDELAAAGHPMERDDLAAGFVAVANAGMAQAIAQVSVARGVDPRDCALVGFGGAAGQHVCAVARELGMETVLLHPFAGILSAYGIGRAPVSWDGQRDAGRVPLEAELPPAVEALLEGLEDTARRVLAGEGVEAGLALERRLDLRSVGTETALAVREPADGDWLAAFAAEHRARFGYERPGRPVEIVTARVRASAVDPNWDRVAPPVPQTQGPAAPLREERVWFPGVGRVSAPVYAREALAPGQRLVGPALVLEDTGTLVLDPGFEAALGAEGILVLTDTAPRRGIDRDATEVAVDPIQLEVFGSRFMSIAEQMGAVLRNTSVSTNIKERLDYSCAVFDAAGGLVANAPHIPVHLGAMSETVRVVCERFPALAEGESVVTNDPFAGGSHLPDVTVVTPVFAGESRPAFFVASRGHHADIGGKTPGSMPADSSRLEEEGVVLAPFLLVSGGRFEEAQVRERLAAGRYPARSPDDNVAELEAMLAANRAGVALLNELIAERGREPVERMMHELQRAAAGKVAREIARLPDGRHAFSDQMDDGTPVQVALEISGSRMGIDFAGTGAVHPGNLNAPPAVVNAAVIYTLRSLVAEPIPLNGGCLEPVELRVPPGSLLDPPDGAAVVGGNVETSQRIVDVLLGALGTAAASQGTMNNVTFGDAHFGYYETLGGGTGATAAGDGASGVHSHMTNTRITDAEVLEARHPVRLVEFSVRRGSGGAGRTRGGDGLVRRYHFLAPVTVSLLCERRTTRPWGVAGGEPGVAGRNVVERGDGRIEELPGRATTELAAGDTLRVETPGGGGFGAPGTPSTLAPVGSRS
ncbi:MAG: hydantoinase B/oxoprolinase family protein [Myxococcota bacterium]|nr:hydantoinase B/oxoprolinase family protein [Myxococcota bacterium]